MPSAALSLSDSYKQHTRATSCHLAPSSLLSTLLPFFFFGPAPGAPYTKPACFKSSSHGDCWPLLFEPACSFSQHMTVRASPEALARPSPPGQCYAQVLRPSSTATPTSEALASPPWARLAPPVTATRRKASPGLQPGATDQQSSPRHNPPPLFYPTRLQWHLALRRLLPPFYAPCALHPLWASEWA